MATQRHRVIRILSSRRVLAALLLVLNDLRLWWTDADPQSLTNFLCDRTDFPTVVGPCGWNVTAHRLDCTLLAKRSTTYVYMHGPSGWDDPTDLIFRYVGARPKPLGPIGSTSSCTSTPLAASRCCWR